MSFCPNCGSYISPGINICSCGTNFGYSSSEPERSQQSLRNNKKNKEKYLKAIEYIDKALETPDLVFISKLMQKHISMQECMINHYLFSGNHWNIIGMQNMYYIAYKYHIAKIIRKL